MPGTLFLAIRHYGTMMVLECHMFFRGLFMCQIEEEDAGECTDEEYHIKPAVIEVELQFP